MSKGRFRTEKKAFGKERICKAVCVPAAGKVLLVCFCYVLEMKRPADSKTVRVCC